MQKRTHGNSREEAKKIIGGKGDCLPIDVTPDGLYEAAGGRLCVLGKTAESEILYDIRPENGRLNPDQNRTVDLL